MYRVFTISSTVTNKMIHSQVEVKYLPQTETFHSAASVWETEKVSTPTPTTPTHSSTSALLQHKLPSSLITLPCSLIKPLQAIKGTLYLSKDSLAFIVDPEMKKERLEKINEIDTKLASGRKGENKWLMLDEMKNEIWSTAQLQAEEFRYYQVCNN